MDSLEPIPEVGGVGPPAAKRFLEGKKECDRIRGVGFATRSPLTEEV